jgi:adenylosuccinate lyase
MRRIWSEAEKRRTWRRIWVALAEVQVEFGLVQPAQAADLRQHAGEIDIPRALAIEAEIHHDVMAEVRVFAGQCPVGGGILHLGMTSADVIDNADVLRLGWSLDLILSRLKELLFHFCEKIERWADTPVMAFTHLQPAEPTTLGYRLAGYAQDLLQDLDNLALLRARLKGKGIKGAVGSRASFAELVGLEHLDRFEARFSEHLGLPFFSIASQVYPRKQDYEVLAALAGLGASLYKFAFDLRLLQSPPVGELAEPFGSQQVGSSAMPFKRNPVRAEKINSLARSLAQAPRQAWDNAAHSLLERTLDDSANRRFLLPESCLTAEELLIESARILSGLVVDEPAMKRNLLIYGPFAATERVLMALVKAGADRQEVHARLREHSLAAWEVVRTGEPNPLSSLVTEDARFWKYLEPGELLAQMDAADYIGDTPQRARALAAAIRRRGEG